MKAIVYYSYGSPDVLKYEDIEVPNPGVYDALIRVRAASINPLDWRLMRGVPYLVRKAFRVTDPTSTRPGRVGRDVAGQVVAVGEKVTQFKPGDAVFGWCEGACAQYACAPESSLIFKADNVTFEQAASLPVAALSSLQGLRDKGRLRAGQKVLINGAAGGMGTFAVQIAKSFGADVTGVCSTRNLGMVRSIGADYVIDYTQEDFTKSAKLYDLILDCVGNHTLSECRRALSPRGVCVIAGAPKNPAIFLIRAFTAPAMSRFVGQTFLMLMAKLNQKDLAAMQDLVTTGKVTPVIDKRYRLSEVPEAIRYLEAGHAQGKVVINLGEV